MITSNGKTFMKRYLAGQAGQMVGALSVGIGNTAASLSDIKLQFEFARIPVDLIAYDFSTDKLVFKGSLPDDLVGKIYELGIWTSEINASAGNQASRIITTFDSETEDWTNETLDTLSARIGVDALKHTPGASATTTSSLSELTLSFGDYSASDRFVMAWENQNTNASIVRWRFATDASNYYEFTQSTPTTGYKITEFTKGSATITGTPNWDDINILSVITTSTAGGASSVIFDAIRIEDMDTIDPEYGLIARFVPASPIVKAEGLIQDFEYALTVTL